MENVGYKSLCQETHRSWKRWLFQTMFFDVCYANLATISNVYVHHVVVHADNFVHPVYGDIGTQTIEGLWMQVKWKLWFKSRRNQTFSPRKGAFFGIFLTKHFFGQFLTIYDCEMTFETMQYLIIYFKAFIDSIIYFKVFMDYFSFRCFLNLGLPLTWLPHLCLHIFNREFVDFDYWQLQYHSKTRCWAHFMQLRWSIFPQNWHTLKAKFSYSCWSSSCSLFVVFVVFKDIRRHYLDWIFWCDSISYHIAGAP